MPFKFEGSPLVLRLQGAYAMPSHLFQYTDLFVVIWDGQALFYPEFRFVARPFAGAAAPLSRPPGAVQVPRYVSSGVFRRSSATAYVVPTFCFVYAGNVNGTSVSNSTTNVNLWSSTANDSSNGYNLNLNSNGNVNPQNTNNKYNGFSVRCLAGT